MISDLWNKPAVIAPNNFVYKSLSCWSYNPAVGCEHACRFCYVPAASTIRLTPKLKVFGVKDADEEWGQYVFVRPWNEHAFRTSLIRAEHTPDDALAKDGNRAVMFSTTTDAYQVVMNDKPERQRELQAALLYNTRRALEVILNESTINVRILTRSPLAVRDFDLMKKFGNRLLFGMSIPTLRNDLARIYEPKAPAPTQRLETLKKAKQWGLNVFAAVAPVYPDCDKADMIATLEELKKLDPITLFMEPINIRSENVARIENHARELGVTVKTDVFASQTTWSDYAFSQLLDFENAAKAVGIADNVIHLWPDKSLMKWASKVSSHGDVWLRRQWNKTSRWPK